MTAITYLAGFSNHFQTEAIKDALPKDQNSPQKVPYGLYTEQLSGTAFSVLRHNNLHSWLYRILPSVLHSEFKLIKNSNINNNIITQQTPIPPTQLRWTPPPYPKSPTDFINGLITIAHNGDLSKHLGAAIHLYAINKSMQENFFYNADGDFLIVPQAGKLIFKTEFGILEIQPGEIIVIPRGIKYQVDLIDKQARGYILENFGPHFRLPELGVIGANGLANPRDFLYPTAAFEEKQGKFKLLTKFQGNLWSADIKHSPLNVVAWHGNYAPYKYDLQRFNTINSVSFDHIDPSIFTVLTSPSLVTGVANIDFVIFPDRWMVAEHTFRPPYFHRNIMSEYMGLIHGAYDAKEEGFVPGGGSLHNCMSAHGPDADAYHKAINATLKPIHYHGTLAFMFESCYVWQPTKLALEANFRQKNYLKCWKGLTAHFSEKNTNA